MATHPPHGKPTVVVSAIGVSNPNADGYKADLMKQIDPSFLQDELLYWSEQLQLYCGLLRCFCSSDASTAKTADVLARRWKEYCEKVRPTRPASVFVILEDTKTFLKSIKNRLENGEWLGLLYVQMVDHMMENASYFEDRITGIVRAPNDEICFWTRLNAENAGLLGHLLDYSQRMMPVVEDYIAMQKRLYRLTETRGCCCGLVPDQRKHRVCVQQFLLLALNAARELDLNNRKLEKDLRDKRVSISPGLLHPQMLTIINREGQRSIKMLDAVPLPDK